MSSHKRKVIVTGGPTREWIDPVRFISNPSSGKMGQALAEVAHEKGYETVFIHGPINVDVSHAAYRKKSIETTSDLLDAVLDELEDGSILIMAAAPADYTPQTKSDIKMKKTADDLVIQLQRTPDILKTIAQKREKDEYTDLFVVGFAAETHDTHNYALKKLKEKKLEMICLNDVSQKGAGFGTDTNILTVYSKNYPREDVPLGSKKDVATKIFKIIESSIDDMILK